MEYGKFVEKEIFNKHNDVVNSDLHTKYVGFTDDNECLKYLFSINTIKTISDKITQLLRGVHPDNLPIKVPDSTIYNVMDNIYYSFRPPTGDIYGRYNIPSGSTAESYVQDIIDQVIEVIVADVKITFETDANNAKLSAWVQVYGDFNDNQLRAHPLIKTRLRRPAPFQFNMNY
jgi:hypothetical protein